jgi:DNA modification methylase
MPMIRADAHALPLRDMCVQCVVTSPPYWGLRDYGIAGQLGLEPTPDAYVANLVQVFRQVWRVLKDDGVLFLNLGDSYTSNSVTGRKDADIHCRTRGNPGDGLCKFPASSHARGVPDGLKPKNLCGIPWRVAFALQTDGWYLRSDIIWAKPNPMPESVTDRPTKSHEYVFLLTKRERYYWNAEAVREPHTDPHVKDGIYQRSGGVNRLDYTPNTQGFNSGGRGVVMAHRHYNLNGRNIRSVWPIATQPYVGAHFATMPEKLIERCVLAGSRPRDYVFDPFLGSGTVARVALRLGRKAVGTDLNRQYLQLADERMHVTLGLPFEWDEAAP